MNEDSARGTILLVDDQPENLDVVISMLEPRGYDVRVGTDGEQCLQLAMSTSIDLILLDVNMPGIDGFETCRRLKQEASTRDVPVIFLTARVDSQDVVRGFRTGSVDYLAKPFNEEELAQRVETHIQLRRSVQQIQRQKEALEQEIARRDALTRERDSLVDRLSHMTVEEARRWGLDGFVGGSDTLRDILAEISRLQQANVSVLVTGESGTGKELVARAIHHGSSRSAGPFIPVNCSAIPDQLADSLFLGHVKGAFTGADADKAGYFEVADGGTLFLDEIGDMPLDLQAKLLRVLEERRVMRVGDRAERDVDVRVVSATNVDLLAAIEEKSFRQDLYYRVAGYHVQVPPLRQRREDVPLLAQHFVAQFARDLGIDAPGVSDEVMAALQAYDFPGNIRELRNVIEGALVACGGGDIESAHLKLAGRGSPVTTGDSAVASSRATDLPGEVPLRMDELELYAVQRAMRQTDGNVSEAARVLGISRARLYRRLQELGT